MAESELQTGAVVDSPVWRRWTVWAFVLWLVVMACSMGLRDLWSPDEPRYAEVSREMVLLNDWVVPHLNGEIYTSKPPLTFWLIAISAKLLGGFSHFAMRLPSFLAGLCLIWLTYLIGSRLFSRRAGALSALVVASTYELLWFLTRLNMDTLFACGVVGSIFCFYLGQSGQADRRWAYTLGYLGMSLAVMTKGLAASALVVVVMACWLAYRRDWRGGLRMLLSPGGLAVLALVLGVWVGWAWHRGGMGYMKHLVLKHNFSMTVKSYSHRRPIYYYFVNLPLAFIPWVMFLPAAVIASWRRRREAANAGDAFLLVAAASMFVLMSLSSAKRINYLMSMMPLLSVLVGAYWAEAWESGDMGKACRWGGWILAAALGLGAAVAPVGVGMKAPDFLPHALAAGALSALAAIGMTRALLRRRPRRVFALVLGLMLTVAAYAGLAFFPALNSRKSLRPLGEYMRQQALAEPKAKFASYRFGHPGPVNFYSRLMLYRINRGEQDKVRAFLDTDDPRYCLVDLVHLDELRRVSRRPLTLVFIGNKGRHHIGCVVNRSVKPLPR